MKARRFRFDDSKAGSSRREAGLFWPIDAARSRSRIWRYARQGLTEAR